ncbi:putative metalloprotease CJM1_0395 family protein [Pseudomonas subflava]|uniref:putative metalloprotease CJM1_0395 family protein n=1 Tax=Pseudomonas subflava TaxID=2952933 RepID=UPI00207A27DB|nr:putative metalloprotease CJM1_0395 family protein [Pseudomonas subflava]
MQIGSATSYVAPLPSSQAARPAASDPSLPADAPADPRAAPSTAPRDDADSRDGTFVEGKDKSARELQLLREEQLQISELARRDREVRSHEQAHASVGGAYAGAPTYSFKRGPDGKSYAVAGEVSIDASAVPNDPEATLRKMALVLRAALAPAEPSAQDRRVAAQAQAQAATARAELAQMRREETSAAAEERALSREERLAEEEKQAKEDEKQPAQSPPPGLDLYRQLAQLQAPPPAVDLLI